MIYPDIIEAKNAIDANLPTGYEVAEIQLVVNSDNKYNYRCLVIAYHPCRLISNSATNLNDLEKLILKSCQNDESEQRGRSGISTDGPDDNLMP